MVQLGVPLRYCSAFLIVASLVLDGGLVVVRLLVVFLVCGLRALSVKSVCPEELL